MRVVLTAYIVAVTPFDCAKIVIKFCGKGRKYSSRVQVANLNPLKFLSFQNPAGRRVRPPKA